MKKKLFVFLSVMILSTPVFALASDFRIDLKKIFTEDSKTQEISSLFSSEYKIENGEQTKKTNKEFELLAKKATYLLLGNPGKNEETSEEYYQRNEDFMKLRYDPDTPTIDGELDYDSEELADDTMASFVVSGMFDKMSNYEFEYNYIDSVKIVETNTSFMASVMLPRVNYKVVDREKPETFKVKKANLTIYYTFKKNEYRDNQYQILYIEAETDDTFSEYFEEIEQNENQGIMGMKVSSGSGIDQLYDFSKLEALSDVDLQNIYNQNIDKIMILSTYYNNSVINLASGFLLTKNVLVTSWSYLEKSLVNGQYIAVRDKDGNVYPFDGIITINTDSDIALLKISDNSRDGVILGDSKVVKQEDPVITLNTKSGLGISSQAGIVISNENKLQSLVPLTENDSGSPLFNAKGEVVGINSDESINTTVSYANYTNNLKILQDKLKNNDKIETVTFEKLKEQYYYSKKNKTVIDNDIKKNIWDQYSKIGNIEETIPLSLIKASYSKGMLSLRYDNKITKIIDNNSLIGGFVNNLKKEGYKEVLKSQDKSIYQNNKYKIIIRNEFDYLIVVMVKL